MRIIRTYSTPRSDLETGRGEGREERTAGRIGPEPVARRSLDRSVRATWGATLRSEPQLATLQRVAQRAVLERIIAMSQDERAAPEVRGAAIVTLTDLLAQLRSATPADPASRGHIALAVRDVRQVLEQIK